MSIATEITRIQTARNTLRTKAVELGIAPNTAKLDALAAAYDGILNRGAVSASVQEGDTYTIPEGYHNGSGTVSGVAGGGNYNLQSKSVAPTKSQQSVTPGQWVLRPVRRHRRGDPGGVSGRFERDGCRRGRAGE